MHRTEIKLDEGGSIVSHDLSQEEIDDVNERTRIENIDHELRDLEQSRKDAVVAELEKLVDLENGTTEEAIAYRALRDNNGQ